MGLIYWLGTEPTVCQISGKVITTEFVDGMTSSGRWAIMHPDTHRTFGRGLGQGKGQWYVKEKSGRWRKVEG